RGRLRSSVRAHLPAAPRWGWQRPARRLRHDRLPGILPGRPEREAGTDQTGRRGRELSDRSGRATDRIPLVIRPLLIIGTIALLLSGPASANAAEPRASLPDVEDEVMCTICGTL